LISSILPLNGTRRPHMQIRLDPSHSIRLPI